MKAKLNVKTVVAPFGVGDFQSPVHSYQEVMETIAEMKETHIQELAEMNACLYTFTDEELVAHCPEFFVEDYQWAFPKPNGTIVLDDGTVYDSYEDFQRMLEIRAAFANSEELAKLNYSDVVKKRMMFRSPAIDVREFLDSSGRLIVGADLHEERLRLSAQASAIKEENPDYFEHFLNIDSNPAYIHTFESIYGMPLTEEAWIKLDANDSYGYRAADALLMLKEFIAGYDDKLFVQAIVAPYSFK